MKRLQIMIDQDLDDELGIRARRLGTSKAALIRQYVRAAVAPDTVEDDPLDELVGAYAFPPANAEALDDVIYG